MVKRKGTKGTSGRGQRDLHVKVKSAAEVPHAALVAWIRASL